MKRPVTLWVALLLAIGALLRLGAASGSLWLDEIWSLERARSASSLVELLQLAGRDNTHLLNSLVLWCLDPRLVLGVRLLGLISGAGLLCLFAVPVLRTGRGWYRLAAAVLCFPLVLYASEARGYAPMLLFLALAWCRFESYRKTSKGGEALLFGGFAGLAILSHLSSLPVIFAWSIFFLLPVATPQLSWNSRAAGLGRLFFIPLLIVISLCLVTGGTFTTAGGPPSSFTSLLLHLFSLWSGLPQPESAMLHPIAYWLGIFLGLTLIVGELRAKNAEGDARWIGALLMMVLPFAAALLRPDLLSARYLLPSGAVAFSLAIQWCERALLGKPARAFAIRGLMLALLFLHAGRDLWLLAVGRGEIGRVVGVLRGAGDTPVTVGGDHDGRIGSVLQFYAQENSWPWLRYVSQAERATAGDPDWMIVHRLEEGVALGKRPDLIPTLPNYELRAIVPHVGESGWSWLMYRRLSSAVQTSPQLQTSERPSR